MHFGATLRTGGTSSGVGRTAVAARTRDIIDRLLVLKMTR
jgi:hypothetical protein